MATMLSLLFFSGSSNGFTPNAFNFKHSSIDRSHSTNQLDRFSSVSSSSSSSTTLNLVPTNEMLSVDVSGSDMKEIVKSGFIVLLFGGGLIPAAISANKSLIGTLSGKRRGGEEGSTSAYIESSGATGPSLPNSFLLFASERIPLVDIIAILGRIQNVDSIADWKNLASTKYDTTTTTLFWLPRSEFKENIRKAKFNGWPIDSQTGEPLGGKDLEMAEKKRVSQKNAVIGDAALDAVFDSWAWGASIATPDKVAKTLEEYSYENGKSVDLGSFVGAAARGRAVTGIGALSFIVIQAVAYGALFVAPLLRVLANIDIGFGQLGECGEMCTKLF